MIRIAHLLDDGALGGVTRFLDALEGRMGPAFQNERYLVSPRLSLPRSIDADAIVVHFAMSWAKLPYLWLLRASTPRTPIVIVEHSYSGAFEDRYVPSQARFRTMLRRAYARADRVVSVSYGQAHWLRRANLLPASKLWVIRPFTDCAALSSLAPPDIAAGPLRLGAFGRYCAQKDFATLVAAMSHVDPATACLDIRGFGSDANALRLAAKSLPHVSVGGAVDDLGQFLSGTDAVVVPSVFEPFGQVALEARLAARPLIVTSVDGLPEQVDPAFGFIVPAASPASMAAAIEAMAEARRTPEWTVMCNAARASAADHITTSVTGWQRLLRELCARQASATPAKPALVRA